jgi:pyridoxine 4-dehydrogenase
MVNQTEELFIGLTWRPTPCSKEQAFAAMKAAYDHGAVFWNGGEFYGTPEYNSLHLVAEYFTRYPAEAENVVLCIKGGLTADFQVDGSRDGVRRSVDNVLRLLDGKKSLDVFECARVDPKTPIEVTIEALAEYVRDGKIKGISLSEVKADTIRRAHKVHPICAVEVELSLWATDILDNGIASTCAELGIPVVAYSPLGRGFLTGEIKSPDDIPEGDFRRWLPRFQPEAFGKNMEMVNKLQKLAENKACSPAQLALTWVKHLSGKPGLPDIIPIPGATTDKRVIENTQEIKLTEQDLEEIDQILTTSEIVGGRYGGHQATLING